MASNDKTRYYWFKLSKNYFDRHDIKILESMPNGKEYSLLLLKLLCESTPHEGRLRFSEYMPYDPEMISSITNTSIDTVKVAFDIYQKLGLVEIWEDGTIYMRMIEGMIGSETGQTMRKKRCSIGNDGVKNTLEIRDKSKSKKKDKRKSEAFTPPTLEEVSEYCNERTNGIDPGTFIDFYEARGWMLGKNKMKDWKAAVRTWERRRRQTSTNNQGGVDDGSFDYN